MQWQKTHGVEVAQAAQAPEIEKFIQKAGERKRKEIEDKIKANTDKLKANLDACLENFRINEAALCQQAFVVIDVSKDGMLQEQEVVDALTPKHPLNKKLHEAIGCLHYYDKKNSFVS